MKGLHLTADLYGCRCEQRWLTDADALGRWCMEAADAVGLPASGHLFHTFAPDNARPGGVAGALLSPESHVCLHTWPDSKAVTCDVYVCEVDEHHSAKARGLMFALVNRFQPEWTEQRSLDRGDDT